MNAVKKHANSSWTKVIADLFMDGHEPSPRGMRTKELTAYQSRWQMARPVITIKDRGLGYRFMAAEAAWICGGDNRVSSIAPYSKAISQFSDDGVTFFGAYGPKFVDQAQYVAQALARDPDTRQAVLTVWRERPGPSKDVPCTVAFQWLLRRGVLDCLVTMRSSDVWLGLPYDVVNFSCMSAIVGARAKRLGAPVERLGVLTVTAGSQHLYEREWLKVEPILARRFDPEEVVHDYRPLTIEHAEDEDMFVQALRAAADGIMPLSHHHDWFGPIMEAIAETKEGKT